MLFHRRSSRRGKSDRHRCRTDTAGPSAGRQALADRPRCPRHGERSLPAGTHRHRRRRPGAGPVDLDLRALVDRLELGAVVLFGQLVVYGLATDLPVTVQVGLAVLVVVLLDVLDRKLVARYLE